MRRRFFLLDNPSAGRLDHRLAADVCSLLTRRGAEIARSTGRGRDAALAEARAAAEAGRCDAVLVAGGDGTIRMGAEAVAGTGVPLGVIPLGTGNVLANEVDLPRDAEGLARLLAEGAARPIATATANGHLFLLMAGAGFDGHVIAALDHARKARVGKAAFVTPVVKALMARPQTLSVEVDGHAHRAAWVIVTNASRYGSRFRITSRTHVEQPGLVAMLVDAPGRSRLAAALLALAAGRLESLPFVRAIPCRHAKVTASPPVPVQVDGDALDTTPLEIADGGPQVALILP